MRDSVDNSLLPSKGWVFQSFSEKKIMELLALTNEWFNGFKCLLN
jgi:hypothetical protein